MISWWWLAVAVGLTWYVTALTLIIRERDWLRRHIREWHPELLDT